MSKSYLKVEGINNETLFVSFAGHDVMFGGIPRFEFVNFFNNSLNNVDRHFYIDVHKNTYHNGISGISRNVDETVVYLKQEIEKYKNVIFLGVSGGGYAAILFGSLLNVTSVVAFIPQTRRLNDNIDERYRDISQYINNTTNYYLYGSIKPSSITDVHNISHCLRISHHPNVLLSQRLNVDLKQMRNDGELYSIFSKLAIPGTVLTTIDKHKEKSNVKMRFS
jgi:hypothetical protein